MAVEQAQHLIAMSLGKMAVSRNQRGGANLHRSLLVATVLHKARTTIMMENFQAMMQQRRAQMEAQQQQREEEQLAACPPTATTQEQENQENCPPQQQQHHDSNNNNSSCVLGTSSNTNSSNINSGNVLTPLVNVSSSENHKPMPLQESAENNKPNCARCLKRRVTELGPADDVYNAKRLKYESDSELCHDTSSRADCTLAADDYDDEEESETQEEEYPGRTQTPEPMQTDPVQISNLVHRFNSGLSGLLSQVEQQQQCNSEQQFTSCCTQVMDSGIESLSRPCIALTV